MTTTPLLEAVDVVREYRSPRRSLRTPGSRSARWTA